MTVTVGEMKAHLRILHDEEDGYIQTLIRVAQATAEEYCRVTFDEDAPQSVRLAIMLMVSHYYENREDADKHVYLAMRMAFENVRPDRV